MINFYTLTVNNVIRETDETVSLVFEVPEELKSVFSYKNGQYITLKIPVNGKENRRAYSLSSSPIIEDNLTVTIKKVDDGLVSSYINENIKVGDKIEIIRLEK